MNRLFNQIIENYRGFIFVKVVTEKVDVEKIYLVNI